MKRKVRSGIILTLIMSTLLSLIVSVNAATFDTAQIGTGSDLGSAASSGSWGVGSATGTRFVIELNDEEVGGTNSHEYYVNYMQNKDRNKNLLSVGAMFYGGNINSDRFWVNGKYASLQEAKLVDFSTGKITNNSPKYSKDYGNWFTNWRSTTDTIKLNITDEGVKFLAKIIGARALDRTNPDYATYNKMKELVEEKYDGKIAVRAEILFSLKLPDETGTKVLTYNEFRKIANDGKNGGGIAWARRGGYKYNGSNRKGGVLDQIACKLYEDDIDYALKKDGTVNCSCNFLDGTWSSTYDKNLGRTVIINTGYDGKEKLRDNTNESNRKIPNLCSICVAPGKYYSLGLRDENGGIVSGNIRLASLSNKTAVNAEWAQFVSGADFMKKIGMGTNSPVIFEGWDYVYKEVVKPKTYTVTENWVELNNTSNVLQPQTQKTVSHGVTYTVTIPTFTGYTYYSSSPVGNSHTITANTTITHYYQRNSYTVTENWVELNNTSNVLQPQTQKTVSYGGIYTVTKPNFAGYTYYSSSPAGDSHTITGNTTITHYYQRNSYTVAETWIELGTGIVLKPAESYVKKEGESHTFKGPSGYSSTTHVYNSSMTTNNNSYHNWNSQTESKITVSKSYIVTHYYEKLPDKYTVTIKYIDDENNGKDIIGPKYKKDIVSGTTFPKTSTIKAEYLVEGYGDITGIFGNEYKGYELDINKIVIDGTTYTTSNMLNTLTVDSNKVIEFHYKLKPAELIKRVFYIKEIDGKSNSPEQVYEEKQEIKIDKNISVSRLKLPSPYNGTYIGHKVLYTSEIVNETALDKNEKASVKIPVATPPDPQITRAYADFFYKEQYYTLTIKFQDMQGNTLQTPFEKIYPKGTRLTETDMETIIPQIIQHGNYGYEFVERSDGGTRPTPVVVDATKEIIVKYDRLKVTIKYINDEDNTLIKEYVEKEVALNQMFPKGSTIDAEYKVDEPAGQFGKKYKYYELDINKIVIDGTTYGVNNMPTQIKLDSSKVIEFHYKLKLPVIEINNFLIKKIDDKPDNSTISHTSTTTNNFEKSQVEKEQKVKQKPDEKTKDAEYIGYMVTTYDAEEPTWTNALIHDNFANNPSEEAPYKVEKKENDEGVEYYPTKVRVDFLYAESWYSVKIKYEDEEGNPIPGLPDIGYDPEEPIIVKEGEDYQPTVPEKWPESPAEPDYEYIDRSDEKEREDPIEDIDEPIEVVCKYKTLRKLIINYVSLNTKRPINPPVRNEIRSGLSDEMFMNDPRITEELIPTKYKFISRTDDKPKEEDNITLGQGTTEITFYYWTDEIIIDRPDPDDPNSDPDVPPGSGIPVVSYPKLKVEGNNRVEETTVVVGDTITLLIPNQYSDKHDQMETDSLLKKVEKPGNGWNSEYADVKYIVSECDVYYKEGTTYTLYNANEPIKITDERKQEFELIIPEWVPEKGWKDGEEGYTIKAIVATSEALEYDEVTCTRNWNDIYEESGAIGTVEVNVFGKVYDFTITNLIEDKYWAGSLYDDEVEYKAKIDQTNEEIGVLPIGQGTTSQQQQKYNHGIALGSTFFFNVNTLGRTNQAISIKPKFMFVAKDGDIIEDVTLYSKNGNVYEEISEDQEIQLQTQLNNDYKKDRTDLGLEMQKAFAIEGFKNLQTNYKYNIGNYARLLIDKTQRVPFVNYLEEEGKEWYDEVAEEKTLQSACHWYGEYRLPSSTIVMEGNAKPGQGTQLKEGNVIVMFQVITQNVENSEKHDANQYLLYNKQVVGDQWKNEGGTKEGDEMTLIMPRFTGSGNGKKVEIKVENGYYPVAIYDIAVRASGNYETAGTH